MYLEMRSISSNSQIPGSDSTSRLAYIDVLKAVGIIFVLIGHLFAPFPIRVLIYSFHMPLFFLISGYFLKIGGSFKSSLLKSLKHLIFPYAITCIIMFLCNSLSSDRLINRLIMSLYSIPSNVVPGEHYGITQIGPIWFLFALFWAKMIVYMIMRIQKTALRGLVVISLAVISIVVGYRIWLPFALLNGMVAAVFVWIGSEVKTLNLLDFILPPKVVIISLGIWIACIIGDYIRGLHFSISIFQFPLYGIGFAGAVSATIVLLKLCKVFVETVAKPITAILSQVGRSTLEIMCVHAVDIEAVPWPNGADCPKTCLAQKACILAIRILLAIGIGVVIRIMRDRYKILKMNRNRNDEGCDL